MTDSSPIYTQGSYGSVVRFHGMASVHSISGVMDFYMFNEHTETGSGDIELCFMHFLKEPTRARYSRGKSEKV